MAVQNSRSIKAVTKDTVVQNTHILNTELTSYIEDKYMGTASNQCNNIFKSFFFTKENWIVSKLFGNLHLFSRYLSISGN